RALELDGAEPAGGHLVAAEVLAVDGARVDAAGAGAGGKDPDGGDPGGIGVEGRHGLGAGLPQPLAGGDPGDERAATVVGVLGEGAHDVRGQVTDIPSMARDDPD